MPLMSSAPLVDPESIAEKESFWYRDSISSRLLLPLSWLFRLVVHIRYRYYLRNPHRSWRSEVPVCIVGNITAGGTGKTPLLIWLTQWLSIRGVKVGVVSRGYGGSSNRYPLEVNQNISASECGDEPKLIASKTKVPVIVDPNRVRAAKSLVSSHTVDVILSDDGLQHYSLGRQLEMAVLDGTRGVGNGRFLPAGPLREPVKRLENVDWVVSNSQASGVWEEEWIMQVAPESFINLGDGTRQSIHAARDSFTKNTIAIAGISNPNRFKTLLKNLGFDVKCVAFPDHYRYTENDFKKFSENIFLVTEKDAQKIKELPTIASRCWCLEIGINFSDKVDEFLQNLFKSCGVTLQVPA
ncbi:MAG: tetraacyldisaccharide 4'-kinase [Gammaproteobacteria bacterium]|nr:tetraacyldisaccharide 4'-kinase [Gammaproteobacteria bacterium]